MVRNKPTPKIKLLKELDTSAHSWCGGALLVAVENGAGALRTGLLEPAGPKNNYHASLAVTLNGMPLVYAHTPCWSTSESLLATGYGIENIDSEELKRTSHRLNDGFAGMTQALDALRPLLGLLDSGIYVIADVPHFPTDGNGHFFWDTPDEMTSNSATAVVMTGDSQCVPGIPAFLYPSQMAASFNAERMRHYMERLEQEKDKPRAVAYHLAEYLSVLLDGHHKAAAAAQLGQSVPCLTIIAPTSVIYEPPLTATRRIVSEVIFAGFRVSRDDIPKSVLQSKQGKWLQYPTQKVCQEAVCKTPYQWDKSFADASRRYPTVREYGESIALNIREITNELIGECLCNQAVHTGKLRHILLALSRVSDPRVKNIALQCAGHADFSVAEAAFRVLAKIKNDPQIEAFFIDYLVDHTDPHSLLKVIADSYWTD